mgnify:FL=1
MKADCIAPTKSLADHMMQEWAIQKDDIVTETMPVTQMMMTVIDRITPNRSAFQLQILDYLDTDMICYFADDPQAYAEQQKEKWTPFLNWNKNHFGIAVEITTGLTPIKQPEQTHKIIAQHIEKMNDLEFATLYLLTMELGSLFMALAFIGGDFTPEQTFEAALAEDLLKDEIYLADQYGISPDQERKRKILKSELENARLFLSLL